MVIDMAIDPEILVRLLLAAIVGGIIGYERKRLNKPAGLRTHMLVSMGAALFTIVSITSFSNVDPSRVVAGIVTGIGFLGAGTIFREKGYYKRPYNSCFPMGSRCYWHYSRYWRVCNHGYSNSSCNFDITTQ